MTHGPVRRARRPGASRPPAPPRPEPRTRGGPRGTAPHQPSGGQQAPPRARRRRPGPRRDARARTALRAAVRRVGAGPRPAARPAREAPVRRVGARRTGPRGPPHRPRPSRRHLVRPDGGDSMTPEPTGRRDTRAGHDSVVLDRTFEAPIESVWAAITESGR